MAALDKTIADALRTSQCTVPTADKPRFTRAPWAAAPDAQAAAEPKADDTDEDTRAKYAAQLACFEPSLKTSPSGDAGADLRAQMQGQIDKIK
eukprot:2817033-Pyramimonas_sp.AAC.1